VEDEEIEEEEKGNLNPTPLSAAIAENWGN